MATPVTELRAALSNNQSRIWHLEVFKRAPPFFCEQYKKVRQKERPGNYTQVTQKKAGPIGARRSLELISGADI